MLSTFFWQMKLIFFILYLYELQSCHRHLWSLILILRRLINYKVQYLKCLLTFLPDLPLSYVSSHLGRAVADDYMSHWQSFWKVFFFFYFIWVAETAALKGFMFHWNSIMFWVTTAAKTQAYYFQFGAFFLVSYCNSQYPVSESYPGYLNIRQCRP